jgi:tRNA G37 N-methylase TrmD
VPDVLLSGNHAAIAKWRSEAAHKRAQDNFWLTQHVLSNSRVSF